MISPFRKSILRWRDLLALAAPLAGAALTPSADAADRSGEVSVDGQLRSFSVHAPDSPSPHDGFPLILAFHGGGGRGASIRRLSRLDSLADARGFIVVYPEGVDKHWNDGRSTLKTPQDDVGFVSSLLDRLEADYPVDRGRIYATGISNGALFSERLGCDLSQRIAAIAPVAGALPAETAPTCRPARVIAVMQIAGADDPIMPFDGGKIADFGGRGAGGQVLSVADAAAFWARRNGCGPAGVDEELPPVALLDRTRIIRKSYLNCPPAGPVTVLTVQGGGHAWPGGAQYAPAFIIGRASRQIDASHAIVDFFLSLPRR